MDVTQALKDTENALRDFIAVVLERSLGSDWTEKCAVSPDRLESWRKRKQTELLRQAAGTVEERLLYYADFYDLKTILKKHWSGEFSAALGEWRAMDVWLTELERFRDPDAHRRELLPHQKHLILGIAGEVRTRLIRYRSKMETSDDYFPRIESVRDSVGNLWVPGKPVIQNVETVLRPGDVLEFVVTASDPFGAQLEYGLSIAMATQIRWQAENVLRLKITNDLVRKMMGVMLAIRSPREFHAGQNGDDASIIFYYQVLPPRQ